MPKGPNASPWNGGGIRSQQPTRDYHRIEDADGRRFWIFRDGIPDREDFSRNGGCRGCSREKIAVQIRNFIAMTAFAEIGVTTNFSFLRGASHPKEFVAQAAVYGYAAIGIADRNTLAGVVRAFAAH